MADPLEDLDQEYWEPDEGPFVTEDGDESSKPIAFRLKKRYLSWMQLLREDPNSPYYGMWKRRGDLPRYLLEKGLLALMGKYNQTKDTATSELLYEEMAARAAYQKERRDNRAKAVEYLARAVAEDVKEGNIVRAAKTLDSFLQVVLSMPQEMGEDYAKALEDQEVLAKLITMPLVMAESTMVKTFKARYGYKES